MNKDLPLYIDYCSYEASKYAVFHYHYSRAMPSGKLVRFGVWEHGEFIGVVIFGTGACYNMSNIIKATNYEVCELVRVALNSHKSTVSKIVSFCLKKLKKDFPNLKAIISYADPRQGHKGKIYQAMNWTYLGVTNAATHFIKNGKIHHSRSVNEKRRTIKGFDMSQFEKIKTFKHKYIYLYDKKLFEYVENIVKDYP